MREVAGRLDSHPLGIDLDAETESLTSSMSREDLHRVASNLEQGGGPAAEQTPMQFSAHLGELALFVSGRPSKVWWPQEVPFLAVSDRGFLNGRL